MAFYPNHGEKRRRVAGQFPHLGLPPHRVRPERLHPHSEPRVEGENPMRRLLLAFAILAVGVALNGCAAVFPKKVMIPVMPPENDGNPFPWDKPDPSK